VRKGILTHRARSPRFKELQACAGSGEGQGSIMLCSFALVISIKHHHFSSEPEAGLRSAVYRCCRPKAGDLSLQWRLRYA